MNRRDVSHRLASAGGALVRVMVLCFIPAAGEGSEAPGDSANGTPDEVRAVFEMVDVNNDRLLSWDEYRTLPGDPQVQQRDFRMFDFDRNRTLTPAEFAAIPGRVPASQRGALPDPFDHLVQAAAESIQELFNKAPGGNAVGIDAKSFVDNVVRSLSPDGISRVDSRWISQADPNRDGRVTRTEALRFVEIHLGVRAPSGDIVRMPNGRVLKLTRFLQVDTNHNNLLEEDEPVGDSQQKGRQSLMPLDRNNDGTVTLAEYADPDGPMMADPVEWFRAADSDLDGLLDQAEAERATEAARQVLVPMAFAAFDEDDDGRLSLDEYRLSMLGNPVYAWDEVPKDDNDDGWMSFQEFHFEHTACELLRLYYFHRFDTSGNDKLSSDEYRFRLLPSQKLLLLTADGGFVREVFVNQEFQDIGSPAVSPDGTRIAFDGHRRGSTLMQQKILMVSMDGTGFQVISDGLQPTWSPDGKQFACTRRGPRGGIWIVGADGSQARKVSDGWWAQWSPDGASIAFTKNNNDLWVHELASGENREILSAAEHPYRSIYWNMCWSPDCTRLVFKARTGRGHDIASINVRGDEPDLRVHFSSARPMKEDGAWSPDGKRVVIGLTLPGQQRQLLCQFDPTSDDPPQVLENLDRSLTYEGCCFTPDGKGIIVQTAE